MKRRLTKILVITGIIGLILPGSSPVLAQSDANPVNLELGGEGSTAWNIANIKPGDSGSKVVDLHNAGSRDGFVTIWLSSIISSEGINPASETGNTLEPGELDQYLLFDITADGLSTSLDLPVKITNLPQSATDTKCIEIIPLKEGATTHLVWEWALPINTGNDAQGDSISFTINYLLEECTITDVSSVVDAGGVFTQGVTAKSTGDKGELTINEGTTGKTAQDQPLSDIWIIELDKEPPIPPSNKMAIGLCYETGPEGTTFDQPITITVSYDQSDVPQGVNEKDLVIALWDKNAGQWAELTNCTVDTVNNTISAPTTHFSRYAIFSPVPTPPPPPPSIPSEEGEKEIEVTPPPLQLVEVDMLGETGKLEISADGTVGEPFSLTDPDGNFILDIKSGTQITGRDNQQLSRIELKIVDTSIILPDNTVILTPIYQLTGYTRDRQPTVIIFSPSANLTIKYDPERLPENALVPVIVNYSDELGLIRLPAPPDEVIEIGMAKASITHASLFAVIVEVLPPPPPLPANFEVSNLVINPKQAQMGQPVTITITIANTGATGGSTKLYLIIDGMVHLDREVTLAANSSQTLTFEVSNLSAGRHEVRIAGLSGNFKVVSTAVAPLGSEINWNILDLGIGGIVLLGLVTLYLFRRKL